MQHKDKFERTNWIRKNIDGQTYLFQEVSEKCRMCGESDKSSLKKLAQKEYKQKHNIARIAHLELSLKNFGLVGE